MDDYLGLQAYRTKKYTTTRLRKLVQRVLSLFVGQVEVDGLGGDISVYQPEAQWETVKAKLEFLFIRALYGLSIDSKFASHWKNSKAVGVKRGAYLYYKDALNPVFQAQKLYDTCLAAGDLGELPPVIDIEGYGNLTLTASRIKTCCEKIEQLFGVKPIVYTGFYVWRDEVVGDKTWASAYKLWIASYPFVGWKPEYLELAKNYSPSIPAPFSQFFCWQFTAYAPALEFGVESNYLDLDYASPEFAAQYLGDSTPDPDPDPQPEEPPMRFSNPSPINIRSTPATTSTNKVGSLPLDSKITALEIRATDSNSVWVRFKPDPSWITKTVPEYWVAIVHDGQGPLLNWIPSS